MSETALMTLQDTVDLGTILVKSGYFKDARDASQAVVKVLAGREMGFGPIASMQGINIIQGQPSVGANLLGAAIKRTNKYNYRVIPPHTDDRCEIAFFESGQEVGRSVFTMDDANRAGLTGKQNWKQFPRNMLFARALSNGARWFCPDVFGGVTAYVPEELGATVDENGEVIDVTPTPVVEAAPMPRQPDPASTPHGLAPQAINRPLEPAALQKGMRAKAHWAKNNGGYVRTQGEPITEKQIGFVASRMETLFDNLDADMSARARHDVLDFLYTVDSTKKLTKAEASALIDWAEDVEAARQEAARILTEIAREAGQQELPL